VAKIFTKLNIGDTVATSGTRAFKKLILEGGKVYTLAQLMSALTGFPRVDTDYTVHIRMPTDGQLGVTGTPNAQNVDNLIVATGEFGSNVTVESADGINTTGTAEMNLAVCGRPTNGSIVYPRATDEWALGLLGSADPADTVDTAGRTDLVSNQSAMPNAQEMTTMLFSTKGEMNGTATHENADVAEQVSSYASGELSTHAGAYAWSVPELVDGVLIIGQAYSANKIGGLLEVK
jgi:hypothetical protein